MSGGRYSGIAPGCNLIMVKVLDRKGNGYSSDVLAGISWVLERKEQLGIRILNISVGACSKRGMRKFRPRERREPGMGRRACGRGGGGNNGPRTMSITTPGISRKVITVGCSDDDREVLVGGNRMVDYSGRGPGGLHLQTGSRCTGLQRCELLQQSRQVYDQERHFHEHTDRLRSCRSLLERFPDMSNKDVKLRLRKVRWISDCRETSRDGDCWMWGKCLREKIANENILKCCCEYVILFIKRCHR